MSAKPPLPAGEQPVTLDISLLGRDYKVACKDSERAELLDAVALLDRRMRDIRDAGKTIGTDRVAVMAALNLAHDLLRARRAPGTADASSPNAIDGEAVRRRILSMQSAIDEALAEQAKLL
jgi:cell division protein ZapA